MLVILNNNKKFWNNNQAVKANTPFEVLQAICDISAYKSNVDTLVNGPAFFEDTKDEAQIV